MSRYAVIDFETTGLSAKGGDRVIEVGAVFVENNHIVDEYQSLVDPGVQVPAKITRITGISNGMLIDAPSPDEVFRQIRDFVGPSQLIAHNASFDRAFWHQEQHRIGKRDDASFLCTLLLARRLYPWAPNHRLGTLADVHQLPNNGQLHRALADASLTAHLLMQIINDLQSLYPEQQVDAEFLSRYQKLRKADALPVPPSRQIKSPRVKASLDAASITAKPVSKSGTRKNIESAAVSAKSGVEAPAKTSSNWVWLWWLLAGLIIFGLFA